MRRWTSSRARTRARLSSYWDGSYKNLMSIMDEWPTGTDFENFRAEGARALTRFVEHVHVFGRELEHGRAPGDL